MPSIRIALLSLLLLLPSILLAQSVSVHLDETYTDSYKATVTVSNNSDEPINGWLVRLQLGGPIRNHWRSELDEAEGDADEFEFAFTNQMHNGDLAAGESTTFGFIVDPSNGTSPPSGGEIVTPWPPVEPPENPDHLLYETVDQFPSGPQDDDAWKSLWPGTRWANGPDEGRVEVDEEIAYGGSGKAVKVLYPQGGQQSGGSGAQWFVDLGGEYEELYMSYWVRFDEDFDFVLGGKLPGLGGAISFSDRTHEWSGRLMWREDGKAEFYIHVPSENDFDPGDRFWWNTEGFQATFVPGRWHHIELHFILNNPGEPDGLMEGWFDGVKAAEYPTFYFRDAPTSNAQIAWVFFSTFFGGSSSDIWQARKDEHARFDEFVVSRSRIGYPGMPDDVDADGLPNDWEGEHFGTDSAAIATEDSDGDGADNLAEQVAATDPNEAADRFVAQLTTGEQRAIVVDGKAGRRYTLQVSRSLDAWQNIESAEVLAKDTELRFTLPDLGTRFYARVIVELP